eukprot:gnl/TRDRNA2_/TRDRNA2_186123_c0_seq1.p1 gnl/TRDRNA2_/TRDRNA2_186123_c0~~gnl/TRDRNA2_/TRDRNA2_186123_c0_seq1.p1  ORF type:complete len:190 (-),score=29.04 gnl/TRDRNA2_/TRDRNA2_186123_c0_seq1:72-605(-)
MPAKNAGMHGTALAAFLENNPRPTAAATSTGFTWAPTPRTKGPSNSSMCQARAMHVSLLDSVAPSYRPVLAQWVPRRSDRRHLCSLSRPRREIKEPRPASASVRRPFDEARLCVLATPRYPPEEKEQDKQDREKHKEKEKGKDDQKEKAVTAESAHLPPLVPCAPGAAPPEAAAKTK